MATAIMQRQLSERSRQRLQLFVVLLFAVVVVWTLPLPFALTGLAFGVAALWVGIRSMADLARLRRAGQRGRSNWAVAAGLGLTVVLMLSLLTRAIYYPIVAERERCLASALTDTAAQACQQHAEDRIQDMINRLRQRAESTSR